MAEIRHLNNAPITEAIIDFRVKLPSEFQVETFFELKNTNIVQALEKIPKPDKYITVVLDIDSFKTGDFSVSNGEIWETFANLHNKKNQMFFSSITDETARLFE